LSELIPASTSLVWTQLIRMPSPLEDAVSGAVGSVVAITCTYPLDLAKTRLQAQRRRRDSTEVAKPYTGAFDVLLRIVREEGPFQLYRGLLASCWKAAITNFVFFYALRVSKRRVRAAALLQGILAGVVVQLTILPVDMVVTRLQTARAAVQKSFLQVLWQIIKNEGFWSLWGGIGPGILLTLNPGIVEAVQSQLWKWQDPSSKLQNFLSGAVSKAIASIVTYPYVRAKVQLQVMDKTSEGTPTTVQILSGIVSESGVLGIFEGCPPQLFNAVLKEALLNMVRLEIVRFVAQLFRRARTLTK